MCGTQPRLPSVTYDAPPALSNVRMLGDDNVQQTLRVLTRSRVAYIQAEADQSLRRAFARKTRSPGLNNWDRNALVYYWNTGVSAGTSGWRGPARVGGQTGRHVLLRHGGKWLTRDTGAITPVASGYHASDTPELGLDVAPAGAGVVQPQHSGAASESAGSGLEAAIEEEAAALGIPE